MVERTLSIGGVVVGKESADRLGADSIACRGEVATGFVPIHLAQCRPFRSGFKPLPDLCSTADTFCSPFEAARASVVRTGAGIRFRFGLAWSLLMLSPLQRPSSSVICKPWLSGNALT